MNSPVSAHQTAYSTFLRFHPDANGTVGRPVYIDPKLLTRFVELVDTQNHTGMQIARGMIELRNSAAGITSDTNCNNAFQHRTPVANVMVTYSVLQQGGRGPGVYITDIQHRFLDGSERPGRYKAEPSVSVRSRWSATSDDSPVMQFQVGAVGALPPCEANLGNAAKTAAAFAEGPLRKEGKVIARNGFSLFYTPTHAIGGIGVWLTSEQKRGPQPADCARQFAQLLANTENKPIGPAGAQRHKWYIVGQGAKVFQAALEEYKRLSRHPLSRSHDFVFVDPQVPLGTLKQNLRDNGIDFYHDDNLRVSTMTTASKLHQVTDPTETFWNLHRAYTLEKLVNTSMEEAQTIYKTRNNTGVYFSDIVKKLTVTLGQRWA